MRFCLKELGLKDLLLDATSGKQWELSLFKETLGVFDGVICKYFNGTDLIVMYKKWFVNILDELFVFVNI